MTDAESESERLYDKLASATRRIADLEEMVDSTAARNLKVTAELATAREKALEEAAKACEAESLSLPGDPPHTFATDVAYDKAVRHCAAAVRAIRAEERSRS